ncbi:MAG: hypothetical protein H6660_14785 [Ardenticatenaceae bacterium]|nr:hypothetical protein [Ardenticatenaceae bacterium]
MKVAQNKDGNPVVATDSAPKQAICPRCGGVLELRSRRTMGDGCLTYFWRHQSNNNTKCTGRRRPVN